MPPACPLSVHEKLKASYAISNSREDADAWSMSTVCARERETHRQRQTETETGTERERERERERFKRHEKYVFKHISRECNVM
jgi:hypothetical protein